ncbi:MAG TPA: NIL domain-containing protein [Acidimicrobiia bacterium]|nr:NIL domain-containing protein [Acidimicrobiia bacterium]
MSSVRLFLSFPEHLVDQPIIYEAVRRFDVVPNIRRANVESHSGWVILEMGGDEQRVEDAIAYFREIGVSVNRMEGDVLES